MTLTFQVDATTPACAVAAFCSGLVLDSGALILEAESGGTGNTTVQNVTVSKGITDEVEVNFECPVPSGATWAAGTWTININITTANSNLTWARVYVCRVNSSCVSQATIGSNTAVNIGLGTTGVKSATVSGSSQTPSAGDKVVVVLTFTNSSAHSTQTLSFDSSQGNTDVASPFTAPVAVSGSESIAESGKVVVSEKPGGTEAIAELGHLVVSEAPTGAEHISEASGLVVSEKPAGAESIAESSALKVSAAPTGAEHLAESGAVKVSESPTGAEHISESGTASAVSPVSGAEHIAETGSAVISEKPSASARVTELGKVVLSEKPAGAGRVSELGSAVYSQAPSGQEHLSESGSAITSATPRGTATLNELGKVVLSEHPTGAEHLSESGTALASESPSGAESVKDAASLSVGGGGVAGAESVTTAVALVVKPGDSAQPRGGYGAQFAGSGRGKFNAKGQKLFE